MERIDLLIEIIETIGLYGEAYFKTGKVAKKLNVSQQTISNVLRELEIKGLILRTPSHIGIKISITDSGISFLENYKNKINSFFENPKEIEGTVFTGIGEGKFYIMQKGYKQQFKEKLDMTPYEGTLNLKADPVLIKRFLSCKKEVYITEFKSNNRTFGSLNAYKIKINNLTAAIIIPARTHYKQDTIEIISNLHLRTKLKLKDNDKVLIMAD